MALMQEKTYTIEDIYALPEGKRAELIDGRMYMMAPPNTRHQSLVSEFTVTIGSYIRSKGGNCKVFPAPFAVFLNKDDQNYVEPDISVICDRDKVDARGCKGAPDLIVEILSPSTRRHDRLVKLDLYQRAGVREYWIVDPENRSVLVFLPDGNGSYRIREDYGSEGIGRVNVLEGCFIDLKKVFST